MNGVVKAAVQEPKAEVDEVKSKYTGFPEPLCQYRNTTLPHPSADTSPNASIESSDVAVSRTHARHSSFQLPRLGTSKHKAKISGSLDGPASPGGLALPDEGKGFFQDADAPVERRVLEQVVSMLSPRTSDEDALAMNETGNEIESVKGWEHIKGDHGRIEASRKKSVLKKFHLHHKN